MVRPPRVHMLLVEGSPWGYGNLQGDFNRTDTLRGKIVDGNATVRMQSQSAPRGPVLLRCLQV
jgi:hypothetical protein